MSEKTDVNGLVIENLLDGKNLVCLIDGSKTKIDVNTGKESTLDLMLVSIYIAPICDWKVYQEGTIGSDHFPVSCMININTSVNEVDDGVENGCWKS